jgi:cold shock CspA family protein
MKGKIVKYFSRRGFGFISPEGSQDEIFFHVSNYPAEAVPEIGMDVEFDMIETPKGNEAKEIKPLGDAAEDEDVEEEAPEEEAPEEEAPEEEAPEEEAPEEEAPEEESPEEEAPEAEASGLDVGDIKGVGKATAEKLRGAGFDTVESVAAVDGDAVSEKAGISAKVAAKIVASAKELLE